MFTSKGLLARDVGSPLSPHPVVSPSSKAGVKVSSPSAAAKNDVRPSASSVGAVNPTLLSKKERQPPTVDSADQSSSSALQSEKRIALIGNGAYAHTTPLPNPRNDAEDIAAALKRSGFETIVGIDLDQTKMQEAAINFARSAREADVALFYYSGHAMQFAGIN